MPKTADPVRAYLSSIGKAGGEASGASRRQARVRLEAGQMNEEELRAYEDRREKAKLAALTRWSRRDSG